jgi:hypothetical protein
MTESLTAEQFAEIAARAQASAPARYRRDTLRIFRASVEALRESRALILTKGWNSPNLIRALLAFRAEFLPYDEPYLLPRDFTALDYPQDFKEQIYAAATFVAYCEVFQPWDKLVTGKPGRPARVPLFSPEHDDESSLRHLKLAFRRWLTRELGWSKDDRHPDYKPAVGPGWVYASKGHYEVSLSKEIGGDEDGHPLARWDVIPEQSVVALDPAALLLAFSPDLRPVYDAVRTPFTYSGSQPPRVMAKKYRGETEGEILRGGLDKTYEKTLGKGWCKANPLLTWRELRKIREAVRALDYGENGPTEWRRWNTPKAESDPTKRLWHASDGWWPDEMVGLLARPARPGGPKEELESWPRPWVTPRKKELVGWGLAARPWRERHSDNRTGARCPACQAFVTSPDALQHHDCIDYLLTREGLTVSPAVLNTLRMAVRAENEPVLAKIEELIGIVIASMGHPAEEAERVLTEPEQKFAA